MGIIINGSSAAGNIDLGTNGTITDLAEGGLPNASIVNADIKSGTIALDRLSATGIGDAKYLRGDNTWQTITTTNYGLKDRTWYDSKNDVQTVSTTTYTDLANLSVTTSAPVSTNSKFLILAHIHYEFNPTSANSGNDTDEGFGTKIIRTPSGGSDTALHTSGTLYDTYGKNDASGTINILGGKTFFYVDTPSSSAALTYKIQVASWNSRSVRFSADSNLCDLLVMELLA